MLTVEVQDDLGFWIKIHEVPIRKTEIVPIKYVRTIGMLWWKKQETKEVLEHPKKTQKEQRQEALNKAAATYNSTPWNSVRILETRYLCFKEYVYGSDGDVWSDEISSEPVMKNETVLWLNGKWVV